MSRRYGAVAMIPEASLPSYIQLRGLLMMSAASAVLMILAFPPFDLGPLIWIALVPLFLALSQTRTLGQGALCGLVMGLIFFGFYMQFLLPYGVLPWVCAALYQTLFFVIFGLAAGPAMRVFSPGWRTVGGATAWTLVAYLRAHAPIPFSGGDIAYSQHDQIPLLQMVSITGQLGMTFMIAAVNAALSQALLGIMPFQFIRPATDLKQWSKAGARSAVICYMVLIAAYLWGALVLKTYQEGDAKSIEVAIVQGDVAFGTPVSKEDVAKSQATYLRLNSTVPENVDLTIWPEAALPSYLQWHPELIETAEKAAAHNDGNLLLGAMETLGGEYYNGALLYDKSGQVIDRYYKMDLVAYGEFVPFREKMPFLEKYPIRKHDLTPGDERKVFDIKGIGVAPLICFEAMFSDPAREVCREGADIIAILTGDAWAQNTIEPAQHSQTASMRAIESRRYVCRAASSGVSAVYSPLGEELQNIPINAEGVLAETVYASDGELSSYHRMGDMPLVIACVIFYCLAFWKRKEEL